MNNVNIIGTITRDIEIKYLPSGSALANFSVAINQDYKDKNGQKVQKTTFVECKSFGKQSEVINQYFHKGSRIAIQGELDQESWKTQDGKNRSKLTVKVDKFDFIDKKQDGGQQVQYQQQQAPQGQYQQQQYQQQPQQGYNPQVQQQVQQVKQQVQQKMQQQQVPTIDIDNEIPF